MLQVVNQRDLIPFLRVVFGESSVGEPPRFQGCQSLQTCTHGLVHFQEIGIVLAQKSTLEQLADAVCYPRTRENTFRLLTSKWQGEADHSIRRLTQLNGDVQIARADRLCEGLVARQSRKLLHSFQ